MCVCVCVLRYRRALVWDTACVRRQWWLCPRQGVIPGWCPLRGVHGTASPFIPFHGHVLDSSCWLCPLLIREHWGWWEGEEFLDTKPGWCSFPNTNSWMLGPADKPALEQDHWSRQILPYRVEAITCLGNESFCLCPSNTDTWVRCKTMDKTGYQGVMPRIRTANCKGQLGHGSKETNKYDCGVGN